MEGQSSGRASALSDAASDRLHVASERSRPSSPDPLEFAVSEMFISDANISKMESILDTWSNKLKSNVLMELRKWKLVFVEQHKQEMMKERRKYEAQAAGLKSELDSLKELLHTYETSNQRKDEVIGNLCHVLERQKEKLEKMRAFTHWRLQHAHAAQVARQHYHLQLKKKVWLGWRSLVQKHWKDQVEKACRLRAEEVCTRLSADYEAKLAEHCEAIEKAQAEIHRLRIEREQYEESMKKAFMRGVCALNMEALSMFHGPEGRQEQPPLTNQYGEVSSTAIMSVMKYLFQVSGRVVTTSQQKPSKTVTARITGRGEVSKAARSSLNVMGVAPPMSSVIVERHHPVTQLTIGQATAAKFPRSSQHASTAGARGSSRTHASSCHVHSIKVVD
uniref:Centrosomal protein POC5 n=1 Tax=Salarias fasciatus TaxID=181472 RepID=A0A672GS55_SALFA